MKMTILWSSLASYSVAFFRELALQGCKIQLIFQPNHAESPYETFDLSFCEVALEDSENLKNHIKTLVHDFDPACILMSSWAYPHFMRLTRMLRKKRIFVVSVMDNPWHGTLKQYLGVFSSRIFLKPSIDTFLVAGDRQEYFARRLGYNNLLYGCYAADISKFICAVPISKRSANFLFVGRLVSSKGIEELVKAYKAYRDQITEPWGLKVVGIGPLNGLFRGVPGVDMLGFLQPAALLEIIRDARCFILPSRWEPWGVVIHEAAAGGLPIIASYHCGAITMFVRDGVNGYVVSPDPQQLTKAMVRMTTTSQTVLEQMSKDSTTLAELWSPKKLAAYFLNRIGDFIGKAVTLDGRK